MKWDWRCSCESDKNEIIENKKLFFHTITTPTRYTNAFGKIQSSQTGGLSYCDPST